MADVEDAETAEAVDILSAVDVAVGVRTCVRPFDRGDRVLDRGRFAILEKAGIDVIAETFDGLFA